METLRNILYAAMVNAVLSILAAGLLFGQTWDSTNGPTAHQGGKDILTVKISGTQYLWLAADTVKYSTDGGTSWQVTSTPRPAQTVIEAHPTNASIVMAGQPGVGIYRTQTQGSSWAQELYEQTLVPYRFAVSPTNPVFWLVGADTVTNFAKSSVYRSASTGDTWVQVDFFRTTAHPNANDVLYSQYGDTVWIGGSTRPVAETPDMTDETSAGTKTKGVWYSTNNGTNWSFRGSFGSGTDRNVSALAFSSKSPRLLYAATTKDVSGTRKATLYQSTNAGQNWSTTVDLYTQGAIGLVKSLVVNTAKPETLILASDKGFAISMNRGAGWTIRNNGVFDSTTATRVSLDRDNANAFYLCTKSAVWYTTDAGATWDLSRTPTVNYVSNAVSFRGDTVHAVSSNQSGIAHSINGNWDNFPTGVAGGGFHGMDVAINPSYGKYANACGDSASYGVIYFRNDGGNGWRRVSTLNSGSVVNVLLPDPRRNVNNVYAGGLWYFSGYKNFIMSSDTGKTWGSAVNVGSDEAQILALGMDTISGWGITGALYAGLGAGRGIYKSTDVGSSWPANLARLNGHSIRSISTHAKTHGVLYLSSDSYIWKSTDGLGTVAQCTTSFGGARQVLIPPSYLSSTNYLWAISADSQKIYKTTKSGVHSNDWIEVNTSGLPKPILRLGTEARNDSTCQDTVTIYVATAGGVFKTDPPPEIPEGFTLTGTNCTPCSEGTGPCRPLLDWSPNQECDLLHYELERRIGISGTPEVISQTLADSYTDNSVNLACDGDSTMMVYYRVRAMEVAGHHSEFTGWVGARASAWPDPPQTLAHGEILEHNLVAFEYKLNQNAPNPFNPTTTISYSLANPGHVSLVVFDIVGREVATLVDEVQATGIKSVEFNASNLPSGVYFYRIMAGSFNDIKKLLLLK